MADLFDRLFDKTEVLDSGCWRFTGYLDAKGYGHISVNGRSVRTHRIAFQLYNGGIPKNMCVCHHCDNPWCVNPQHLFLGTITDNFIDMLAKGRGAIKGERNGNARLTNHQLHWIRVSLEIGIKQKDIAKEFGVVPQLISDIKQGKVWRQA